MITRALRAVLAFAWVFAALFAFASLQARAAEGPLESKTVITVVSWDGSESARAFNESLRRDAALLDVVVAREVPDVAAGRRLRHLYVAPDAGAVQAWKQDFGGGVQSTVHPWSELGERSPVGRYNVFAGTATATTLAGLLRSDGANVEVASLRLRNSIPASWYLPFLGLIILSAGLAGADTVAGVRSAAIRRLHGWRLGQLAYHQAGTYVPAWAASGIAVTGMSELLLQATHQPSRTTFVAIMAACALAALVSALMAQLVVGVLLSTVGIPGALKGELPGWALTFTTYSMRFAAAVIALSAAATTLALAAGVQSSSAYREMFDTAAGWSTVTLGDAYTLADQDQLASHVGRWAQDLDREGHLLIAAQQPAGPPGSATALLVNAQYLNQQPLADASGHRLVALDDCVTVMVPPGRWAKRQELVPSLGLATLLADPETPIRVKRAAAGQQLFTYAPPETGSMHSQASSASLLDPVVVVLPQAGGLRPDAYAAFLSAGSALVDHPDTVTRAIETHPQLQRYLKAATPISQVIAAQISELQSRLRLAALGFSIAMLVVVMSGYAAALVAVRRNSQLIFVRHVHGWPFAASHRGGLAVEAVLLVVVAIWIPLHVWQARSQYEALAAIGAVPPMTTPAMTPGQWVAVGLLTTALSLGYLIPLWREHRSVITRALSYR